MLYTLGHTESYERYITELGNRCRKSGRTDTHKGGCVFLTIEEALTKCPDDYSVYGLITDLDNTYEADGGRHIINGCQIVRINT